MKSDMTFAEYDRRRNKLDDAISEAEEHMFGRHHRTAMRTRRESQNEMYALEEEFWGLPVNGITPRTLCDGCDYSFDNDEVSEDEITGDVLCIPCIGKALDAACEAEAERAMSEPPMTADERHQRAWAQKQELTR